MRFRHWCFVINNWTDEDVATLRNLETAYADIFRYVAWGYEVCPSTGTPHLQGALGLSRPCRFNHVKTLFGTDRVHLEPARRILQNYAYAVKVAADGGTIEEYGERPANARGERKEIDVAVEAVQDGMKLKEFRNVFFGMYRSSPSAWVELIADHTPAPEVRAWPLSPWQALLNDKIRLPPSQREIIFIVDRIGNSGKSWFVKYYHQLHGDKSILLQPGKRADMGYIFYKASLDASRRVVFIDCKRSESELLDYRFLESLKDGWMQNGKYNSTTFYFEVPHVIVMMNEMPDMTKLSTDRYFIHSIDRGDTHHD